MKPKVAPITTALPLATEEWRPVVGFEDSYRVSSHGRIYSMDRVCRGGRRRVGGHLMKDRADQRGYRVVGLAGPDGQVTRSVHRLVAEAFIGPSTAGAPFRTFTDSPETVTWVGGEFLVTDDRSNVAGGGR